MNNFFHHEWSWSNFHKDRSIQGQWHDQLIYKNIVRLYLLLLFNIKCREILARNDQTWSKIDNFTTFDRKLSKIFMPISCKNIVLLSTPPTSVASQNWLYKT